MTTPDAMTRLREIAEGMSGNDWRVHGVADGSGPQDVGISSNWDGERYFPAMALAAGEEVDANPAQTMANALGIVTAKRLLDAFVSPEAKERLARAIHKAMNVEIKPQPTVETDISVNTGDIVQAILTLLAKEALQDGR